MVILNFIGTPNPVLHWYAIGMQELRQSSVSAQNQSSNIFLKATYQLSDRCCRGVEVLGVGLLSLGSIRRPRINVLGLSQDALWTPAIPTSGVNIALMSTLIPTAMWRYGFFCQKNICYHIPTPVKHAYDKLSPFHKSSKVGINFWSQLYSNSFKYIKQVFVCTISTYEIPKLFGNLQLIIQV